MSFLFGGGDRDRERRDAASERSEEERERARLEREARRAEREGSETASASGVGLHDPGMPDDPDGEIRASRGAGSVAEAPLDEPRAPLADGRPPVDAEPPVGAEPPLGAQPPLDAEPPRGAQPPHEAEPPLGARASAPAREPFAEDPQGVEEIPQATAAFDPLTDPRHDAPPPQATAPFDPLAYDADAAPRQPAIPFEPLVYDPEAAPATPPPDRDEPFYARDTDDVPAVVVRGRRDAPAGVRRVSASSVASAAGAQGPPRFGAPLRPPARPRRRRRRRMLLLLPLLLVLAAAWAAWSLFQPFGGDDGGERVQVRIPEGLTAAQIGDLLAERGVVDSGFFFSLRARLADDRGGLRSGTVDLRRDMSYAAAIDELTKAPPAAPRTIKVTIPEGRSRREVAPTIREAGLRGSYVAATRRNAELDPRDYGAPRGASLEGFLFPATYDLRPNARASRLVRDQLRAFEENFGKVDLRRARRAKLTRYDVLIIASMIEREATLPKERRLISAVIYNRLRDGINLGIDATIRYALNQWSAPLKVSELESDTPYNTRTNPGLPPGPIGSPGLASIQAAADPADSDALFYVVKPCGEGAHAFSETDAQFQRDVAAYNRAREERGGKDPSSC